jgi:hypothetical protein
MTPALRVFEHGDADIRQATFLLSPTVQKLMQILIKLLIIYKYDFRPKYALESKCNLKDTA